MDKVQTDRTTAEIIGAAMKVHSKLGPGLLESVYHQCLVYELRKRGLSVRSQLPLPVRYDDIEIDAGYRIDLLVQDAVVVELKAVSIVQPVHKAQLLSYLRLSGYSAGLLINFHSVRLKNGITRLVNRL